MKRASSRSGRRIIEGPAVGPWALWHHASMSIANDPSDWIEAAARHANRPFLKTPGGPDVSYAALREQSGRMASALIQCGVQPGERVAAQVDKSAEAIFLYIACLRLGAVFVPINVANTRNEVDYFLRDAQPRVAIFRPAELPLIESQARAAGVAHIDTLGTD